MSAWRPVGTALSVVVSAPLLWLLGCAGFLLRGGVLVLALPIWTLPTAVGISTLLGPAVVNTGRLDGPLLALLAAACVVAVLLALAGLFAAAWIDTLLFDRFLADPETAVLRAEPAMPARGGRPLAALVLVEMLSLAPAAVAASYSLGRIIAVVRDEIVMPGDLAVPLALRAAAGAAGPLLLLAAALVLAEALNGILSRHVLRRHVLRRDEASRPGSRARPWRALGRRLLGVVITAVTGWFLALVVLVPALAAVLVAWAGVRDAYLGDGLADPGRAAAAVVTTVLFVALWAAALLLGGVVSALRSALWTARALVPAGGWTGGGD